MGTYFRYVCRFSRVKYQSTAVIIGAMLISPLMGPIMGFGLGLGIVRFELIKRSFRNFATATILA
mgnify:FL=1